MIHCHVAGTVVKAPALKTSQTGKPYAVLIVAAQNGNAGQQVVSAMVFGDACHEAMQLARGDSVSLTGTATLGTYDRNGIITASLSVMTSSLLSGRKPSKVKPSTAPRSRAAPREESFPPEWGSLEAMPS